MKDKLISFIVMLAFLFATNYLLFLKGHGIGEILFMSAGVALLFALTFKYAIRFIVVTVKKVVKPKPH